MSTPTLDSGTDVAREIATLAVELATSVAVGAAPDVLARCIESEIRQRYGGDAPYVRARPARAEIAQAVQRDRAAGIGVQQLTQRHGISRATLYRYLALANEAKRPPAEIASPRSQ